MVILMLFFGRAFSLIGMGLLGAYVGRTYEEDENGVRSSSSTNRLGFETSPKLASIGEAPRVVGGRRVKYETHAGPSGGGFLKAFVTGGAGFHRQQTLVDRLLLRGDEVVAIRQSVDRPSGVSCARRSRNPRFRAGGRGRFSTVDALGAAMHGCDFVFHLAAKRGT